MVRLFLSMAFPRNLIFDSVLCRAAIETDTRNSEHPKLNLEVVMEGKVAYKSVPPAIHVPSLTPWTRIFSSQKPRVNDDDAHSERARVVCWLDVCAARRAGRDERRRRPSPRAAIAVTRAIMGRLHE
jgi:hypothetical protein